MKKMIQESIHHPYTITEGLLCFVTGLLVISTFGLPVFTKGNLLVATIVSIALTIITFNFEKERSDTPFFAVIAFISFILETIIEKDVMTALTRIAGVLCLVYGMYSVAISFTSEPPNSMRSLKKGLIFMFLSLLPVLLLNIIRHFL